MPAVAQMPAAVDQAADVLPAHENHARAQKTHAGHDLGRNTRGVQGHAVQIDHVRKAVFGNNHEQRGSHRDHEMRANARFLAAIGALIADESAAKPRQKQASQELQFP